MGALVRAVDDALLFVGISSDPEAAASPEDSRNLSEQIIDSIEVGPRLT